MDGRLRGLPKSEDVSMNQMVNSQPEPLALRQIVELQFSGELQAAHDAYVEFFQHNDPTTMH